MIILRNIHACAWSAGLAAAALVAAHAARADVTVVEDTTINAAIVKMHTSATERTTRDKQRRDSDGKVDGMLSMLAGSMRTGDIIRLDRDLEWRLEPDKKKPGNAVSHCAAARAGAAEDAGNPGEDAAVPRRAGADPAGRG